MGTILYGEFGKLDSLGLMSLIVILEEKLQDYLEIDLVLANEKAVSQENSPFRSIQTLTDYIQSLIEQKRDV